MVAYCTAQDAGNWGGINNLVDPWHLLELVDPATDALYLGGHNMVTGDPFQVDARNGTPADPLLQRVTYYARVLSPSSWQAAVTPADAGAGTVIDITNEGVNMGVALTIPWARYIEEESALVGEMMIGNAFPLSESAEVPHVVRRYTAILVAIRAATFVGKMSQALKDARQEARDDLAIYLKGKPLRDERAPQPTNTAVSGVSGSAGDPRGWTRISLKDFAKGLKALPRSVAIATAKRSAAGLTRALTSSFDAGRTAYDEARPLGAAGNEVSLVQTGRTRGLLRFVYDGGTRLRASLMALRYVRYIIRFGILPRGGDPIPRHWKRQLDDNMKAAGDMEAAKL
jgi:hypothetical protein